MVRDRRGSVVLAAGLFYAAALSCSGNAFNSEKTQATAGDGGTGASASGEAATAGKGSAIAGAGGGQTGGAPTTAGSSGASNGGGRAGSAGSSGAPTVGDAGDGAGGAAEPAPPITTDGLLYWFKADAGVQVTEGGISKWADQSGNGFDAVQNLEGLRPKASSTQLLPLPVLEFDGANDLLELPEFKRDFSAGLSFFAVAGRGQASDCSAIVELSNGSEIEDIHVGSSANSSHYEVQAESENGTAEVWPLAQIKLIEVVHTADALEPRAELRVNGTISGSVVMQRPVTTLRATNFIGHTLYTGCSSSFSGAIAEIIMYARAVKPAERATIETYLMNKWQCCK